MKKIHFHSLCLLVVLCSSCISDDSDLVVFNATKIVPEAQKTLFGPGEMGYYMAHVAIIDAKDEGAEYTWYINKVKQNGASSDTCGFYCMKPDTICHLAVDILKGGKTKHLDRWVKIQKHTEFCTKGTSVKSLFVNETMYSIMKYHRVPIYTHKKWPDGDEDWHFKYEEENICHCYMTSEKTARGGVYYHYSHEYHKN